MNLSLMAPLLPPTPPAAPAHHRSDSADYYYFVLTVAVIAIVLVLSNVIAFACCSPCLLIRSFRRRLLGDRTIMTHRSQELIPVCRYKQEQAYDTECAVCLTSFMDGEEVRELPACKHSFHAPCIDMWLYSHSSCPICRASVPVLSPPQRCPRAAAAREDPMPPQQLMAEPIGMVRVIVAMM